MTLSFIRACGSDNTLISIQGLVSRIADYYLGGITLSERLKSLSLHSVVRHINMQATVRSFRRRGKWEIEALQAAKYVEGRTTWDRDNVLAINPRICYFACDRTLRDSFYTHDKWNENICERHSIFVSQGRTPLKGLHKVIEAMVLVRQNYPDVKLYVTNDLNFNKSCIQDYLWGNDYINYIKTLIKRYGLENNIISTGLLPESQMADRFQKSNVFVSASSIENSPNSVAEAQMLGVPCIGSYVGGTMDMIVHGQTGFLYRFEETNMLASLICDVFSGNINTQELSRQEIAIASERHAKEKNLKKMLDIYTAILESR